MKRIFIIFAAVLLTTSVFAQAPQKMSYQAVVRDASNNLVTNTQVGMQISIYQGSVSGTLVYEETQTPTTNANGLLTIEIGGQTGFDTISWANGTYFIETGIDPTGGTNYSAITGTSQLLTVPYALHAKTAESIIGTITENDPVFTGSQANNITATDITNLSNLSGTNTGDQDLSGLATQTALQDTASAIRADISVCQWTTNGNHIYYNNGFVGIGNSSPTASLDIYDNTGYPFFKFLSEDNVYTQWISDRVGVDDYLIGIDGGNNKFMFVNTTTGYYPLVFHGNNVGIGTLNPEAPLHINDFMKLEPRNSAPTSPTKGMIYYNNSDNKVKVYTGSTWENLN